MKGTLPNRSVPWSAEEFVYVDGLACTYYITGKRPPVIWVVVPGKPPVQLEHIRLQAEVKEPSKWRVSTCPHCGSVNYATRL